MGCANSDLETAGAGGAGSVLVLLWGACICGRAHLPQVLVIGFSGLCRPLGTPGLPWSRRPVGTGHCTPTSC